MSGGPSVTVLITLTSNHPGKLADVELHFHDGLLAGLTLVGFSLFTRRDGRGPLLAVPSRYVTVPSDGSTRSATTTPAPFLRPSRRCRTTRTLPFGTLRTAVLEAYERELHAVGAS